MTEMTSTLSYIISAIGIAFVIRTYLNRGGLTREQVQRAGPMTVPIFAIGRLLVDARLWPEVVIALSAIVLLVMEAWRNTTPRLVDGKPVLF